MNNSGRARHVAYSMGGEGRKLFSVCFFPARSFFLRWKLRWAEPKIGKVPNLCLFPSRRRRFFGIGRGRGQEGVRARDCSSDAGRGRKSNFPFYCFLHRRHHYAASYFILPVIPSSSLLSSSSCGGGPGWENKSCDEEEEGWFGPAEEEEDHIAGVFFLGGFFSSITSGGGIGKIFFLLPLRVVFSAVGQWCWGTTKLILYISSPTTATPPPPPPMILAAELLVSRHFRWNFG